MFLIAGACPADAIAVIKIIALLTISQSCTDFTHRFYLRYPYKLHMYILARFILVIINPAV
ncbi:hypothetical protein D3C73_1407650 [compost metagenome]